jgi:hypothetical protein
MNNDKPTYIHAFPQPPHLYDLNNTTVVIIDVLRLLPPLPRPYLMEQNGDPR